MNPPNIPGKLADFFNNGFAKLRRGFNRVRLWIGYRNQALPGIVTVIVHAHAMPYSFGPHCAQG
jgi:hypothetical protein